MPARTVSLLALAALIAAAASAQTPSLVAARHLAPTASVELPSATDVRAASLLNAWVAGDLEPLVAAVAPARRADAWRDFAAFRRVIVNGRGDAVGAHVLGTAETAGGERATTARITFADGTEHVTLRWAADGTLVTMVRSAVSSRR